MKTTTFIISLLAIATPALTHPSTSSSKLQSRQSAISWHQWENLFGNGQWCFWWCRNQIDAPPSFVADDNSNTLVDVQNVQENGGKDTADGATKRNNFAAPTKTIAARHDADIPSEITAPATTVNTVEDIVAAPTETCSEPHQIITAKDGGELHCPLVIYPTDYSPEAGATTVESSATSTAPSSSATSASGIVNAGERIVFERAWTVFVGAVVGGMILL